MTKQLRQLKQQALEVNAGWEVVKGTGPNDFTISQESETIYCGTSVQVEAFLKGASYLKQKLTGSIHAPRNT